MDTQDNDDQRHIETIREFFQDCKEKGLLCYTRYDQEELKTRADMFYMTDDAIDKINKSMDVRGSNYQKFLSNKEHIALNFSRQVYFVRERTEEVKTLLYVIFDPCIIEPNNQLGSYLNQIYKKLGYDNKKKCSMDKAFQKDLRNALSHQDYEYNIVEDRIESITWTGSGRSHTLEPKDFSKVNSQIISTNKIIGKIVEESIMNKF